MKNLAILSLFAVAAISSANLVQDGDFSLDTNSYPAGNWTSTTSVVDWNFIGDARAGQNVAAIGIGYLGAPNREIDLSGGSDIYISGFGPGISQTLNTVAGQQYSISFNYFSDGNAGGIDYYLNNVLTASNLQTPSSTYTRGLYTATFMGTGSDNIEFLSNHGNISHIGNVDVEAVPEPASLSVLGIGVASLLRRRKKSV